MQKEFLVFGLVIALIVALFNFSSSPTEEGFDGYNITYKAGDGFTLTIDRGATTDSDIKKITSEHPYSESWDDFGSDNCPDKYEDGNGGCLKDALENNLITKEDLKYDANDNKDPNLDNRRLIDDKNDNGKWDDGERYADLNGNGKWDKGEEWTGEEKNKKWDQGEYVYDTDGNGAFTKELLAFRWYKIEDVKNLRVGGNKAYIGLDGYTLNTKVCSVKDFLKNDCDNNINLDDLFVECGKTHYMKDSEGLTVGSFNAPACEDHVFKEDDGSGRKPWTLEYSGNDVGKLEIHLKVLDLGSYYVNGDSKLITRDETFTYNCTRIKQSGPTVEGADPMVKNNSPESVATY